MSPSTSNVIELIAGQSSTMYLQRGDGLHVIQGQLQVRPAPEWLGERMVARDSRHQEGGVYVAQRRGYVTLEAAESLCVVGLNRASSRMSRALHLRRLVQMFTRHAPDISASSE